MQFEKKLLSCLKLRKVRKISILLLINFVVLFLFGFTELNEDNLYSYQWGLKNNGNFFVNKSFLRENHKPSYFDKSLNDLMFFDDKYVFNYQVALGAFGDSIVSKDLFDIDWERGYSLFKNASHQRDVVIALIDTGVDFTHYELTDSIWVNSGEIPNNLIDDDRNGYIDYVYGYNFHNKNGNVFVESLSEAHGTHAAGIMVANHANTGIKGLAHDSHVKLMILKVLDSNENGYMSSVIEAINYARNNGAKICNISLGAYTYDKNIDTVMKAYQDMLFVVSAGNGMDFIGYSLDERDVYPAKLPYDNVITVSNASFDGKRYESANYGSYVDVFAPGTFILSTVPGNGFAYLTGTSMASPFVAATCAMIYSRYPKVPLNQYKNIIINGTTKEAALFGLSKSAGLLNVYNSLYIASTY